MTKYINNSSEKNHIREKWVEFAKLNYDDEHEFSMIGLTTETLDDVKLFSEHNLFDITETETGQLRFNKGKFKCFESDGSTCRKLTELLPNEFAIHSEIGFEIGKEYNKVFVELHQSKIFPCDVINLDFTGSISNVTKRNILEVLNWIFKIQNKFQKNFSLFLTFANANGTNEETIFNKFEEIIQENISNAHTNFRNMFETKFNSLQNIKSNHNQFLATGISKYLVKFSSENKFNLKKYDFYYYEKTRHNMISLLFNFEFSNLTIPQIDIYKEDCLKCLDDIKKVTTNEQ